MTTPLFLEATPLQRDIVAKLTAGMLVPEIAKRLRCNETLVRNELNVFMANNKLNNREQVGALAVRAGIG